MLARLSGGALASAAVFSIVLLPAHAQMQFEDVTSSAGVGAELYDSTTRHSLGINWIDFNNDRWPDLFLVNGRDLMAHLYENNGDGTFTNRDDLLPALPNGDMTRSVFADYDRDGDLDIYILTDHTFLNLQGVNPPDGPPNLFLHNMWMETGEVPGTPLFVERAALVGLDDLASPPVGPQPGLRAKTGHWMDHDRDGDQDLYVGHMVLNAGGAFANADRFFRNNGDGTFSEVTVSVGLNDLTDTTTFRPALASIGTHLDNDLWPDLYVANVNDPLPYSRDQYFRNNGGVFEEITGPGIGDDSWAAMGIDVADIDHDGDWDMYISDLLNTAGQDSMPLGNVLYLGNGDGTFADNSAPAAGLVSRNSWGVSFFDGDHDGFEDLLVTTMIPFTDGPDFFGNNGDGTFTDLTGLTGLTCGDARGSATADFDHDGDLDVAIVNSQGSPMHLFRNDTPATGNWLQIRLRGLQSSTEAIGTLVEVDASGITYLRQVKGGQSAHSQDDLVVHVGLGAATTVDAVRVFWSSGVVDSLGATPVNQRIMVLEGITAAPRAVLEMSHTNLNFGLVNVGSTATADVRLFNDGSDPLQIHTLAFDDPAFRRIGGAAAPFTIGPGAEEIVTVEFAPDYAGMLSASLTVTTNDPDQLTASVAVTGEGAGAVGSPAAMDAPVAALAARAAPNPFLHASRIEFVTPRKGPVNVAVFNAEGRRIATLVDDEREAGAGRATWDGRDPAGRRAPAGVYFYRVTSGDETVTGKLVRLR